jgi:hypothetical protein
MLSESFLLPRLKQKQPAIASGSVVSHHLVVLGLFPGFFLVNKEPFRLYLPSIHAKVALLGLVLGSNYNVGATFLNNTE